MNKSRLLAIAAISAGVLGFVPSLATAFHGNLVDCAGGNIVIDIPVKPGLTCTPTLNKLTISVNAKNANQITGCTGNSGGPPWATWATQKWGSGITSADVATINKADFSAKAVVVGICDFNGSSETSDVYASGKFQFYTSTDVKIKTAKGGFVSKLTTTSTGAAAVTGLITKGFGFGATIETTGLSVDLSQGVNGPAAACQTFQCPGYAGTPVTLLRIKACQNASCVGNNDPCSCCTGSGMGTCSNPSLRIRMPDNADCTAAGQPLSCCTGAGQGTCGS